MAADHVARTLAEAALGKAGKGGTSYYYGYYNSVNGKFYSDSAMTVELVGQEGKFYYDANSGVTYVYRNNAFEVAGDKVLESAKATGGIGWTEGTGAEAVKHMVSSDYLNTQNNVNSTSTTDPLSANMGKELQDQVNNLKNIGRFLSIWNASTGAPTSEPIVSVYEFRIGDYYRIGVEGTKNPAPNSTYTTGGTNWVTGGTLKVGDVVYVSTISGNTSTWVKMNGSAEGTVQGVTNADGTSYVQSGSGIAVIPNATGSAVGLVKSSTNYGTNVTSAGTVMLVKANNNEVAAKTSNCKPIVPSNLDIAIKEGLGNYNLGTAGADAWSDAYKSHAREVIGCQQQQVFSADWDALTTL